MARAACQASEERTIRQVFCATRFEGTGVPVSEGANVWHAATSSPSSTLTSTVGPNGPTGTLGAADGAAAEFESQVTFESDTAVDESGTIRFGAGHSLRFSTVGDGYIGSSGDPNVTHGAVSWRVDGGEGQFAGARGSITSNFTVDAGGNVVDHQFGVIEIE